MKTMMTNTQIEPALSLVARRHAVEVEPPNAHNHDLADETVAQKKLADEKKAREDELQRTAEARAIAESVKYNRD